MQLEDTQRLIALCRDLDIEGHVAGTLLFTLGQEEDASATKIPRCFDAYSIHISSPYSKKLTDAPLTLTI